MAFIYLFILLTAAPIETIYLFIFSPAELMDPIYLFIYFLKAGISFIHSCIRGVHGGLLWSPEECKARHKGFMGASCRPMRVPWGAMRGPWEPHAGPWGVHGRHMGDHDGAIGVPWEATGLPQFLQRPEHCFS